MWTTILRGPVGGPAATAICLVLPADAGRADPRRTLSPGERALMRRRAAPPAPARAEFLAGRLAAHALLGHGAEALNGRHGEPVAIRGGRKAAGVALSISHSRGFGMAGTLADEGWSIGVDVESRVELSGRLAARILSRRELRRVARAGSARRGHAALEHWVLKEAALKAMGGRAGVGLLRTPGAIEVVRLSRRGWGRVRMPGRRLARCRLLTKSGVTMGVVVAPRRAPEGSPRPRRGRPPRDGHRSRGRLPAPGSPSRRPAAWRRRSSGQAAGRNGPGRPG